MLLPLVLPVVLVLAWGWAWDFPLGEGTEAQLCLWALKLVLLGLWALELELLALLEPALLVDLVLASGVEVLGPLTL